MSLGSNSPDEEKSTNKRPRPSAAAGAAAPAARRMVIADDSDDDEEAAQPAAQQRRTGPLTEGNSGILFAKLSIADMKKCSNEEIQKGATNWQAEGRNKQKLASPLHRAIEANDKTLVTRMLDNGWNPNWCATNITYLSKAVTHGASHQAIIDLLIVARAELTPEVFAAATQAPKVDWIADFFTKHYLTLPTGQQKVDCGTAAFCACMEQCKHEVAQRLREVAVTLPPFQRLLSTYTITRQNIDQEKKTLDWLHQLAQELHQEHDFYIYLVQWVEFPRALEACDHLFDTIKQDRALVGQLLSNAVSYSLLMNNREKAWQLIEKCIKAIREGSAPLDKKFIKEAIEKLQMKPSSYGIPPATLTALATDQTKLIERLQQILFNTPPPPPAPMPVPAPPRLFSAAGAAAPASAPPVQPRPAAALGSGPRPMTEAVARAMAVLQTQKATEVSQLKAELDIITKSLAEHRDLTQTPEVVQALRVLCTQEQQIHQRLKMLSPKPHPTIPAAALPFPRPSVLSAQHQPGASAPPASTSQNRGSAPTPGGLSFPVHYAHPSQSHPTQADSVTTALNMIDPQITQSAKRKHLELERATIQQALTSPMLNKEQAVRESTRKTLMARLNNINEQLLLLPLTSINTQQARNGAPVQPPQSTPQLPTAVAAPAQRWALPMAPPSSVPAAVRNSVPASSIRSGTPAGAQPFSSLPPYTAPAASSTPSSTIPPTSPASQRLGGAPAPAVATAWAPPPIAQPQPAGSTNTHVLRQFADPGRSCQNQPRTL